MEEHYYDECRYAECHFAKCCYAECHYAECRGALKMLLQERYKMFFTTIKSQIYGLYFVFRNLCKVCYTSFKQLYIDLLSFTINF
jgi:hypothetical protein